jgi:VanZ family protein
MRLFHWLPAVIQASLIFYLSSQSNPPGVDLGPDYVLHSLGYLILGGAISWGMSGGLRLVLSRSHLLLCWLLGVVYGGLDEFHQSFVPGRDPSFSDLAADAVGSAVGVLLFLAVSHSLRRSRS